MSKYIQTRLYNVLINNYLLGAQTLFSTFRLLLQTTYPP